MVKLILYYLFAWVVPTIVLTMDKSIGFPKAVLASTMLNVLMYVVNNYPQNWRNWEAQADVQVYMKVGDKYVPYYIAEKGDRVRIKKFLMDDRYVSLKNGFYLSFYDCRDWKMLSGAPWDVHFTKSVLDGKYSDLTIDDIC